MWKRVFVSILILGGLAFALDLLAEGTVTSHGASIGIEGATGEFQDRGAGRNRLIIGCAVSRDVVSQNAINNKAVDGEALFTTKRIFGAKRFVFKLIRPGQGVYFAQGTREVAFDQDPNADPVENPTGAGECGIVLREDKGDVVPTVQLGDKFKVVAIYQDAPNRLVAQGTFGEAPPEAPH